MINPLSFYVVLVYIEEILYNHGEAKERETITQIGDYRQIFEIWGGHATEYRWRNI